MKAPATLIARASGRAGGALGFAALKLALGALNAGRAAHPVPEPLAAEIRKLLPALDLRRVRLIDGANLGPLRWMDPEPVAIALGYAVYLRVPLDAVTPPGRLLIAHELFHVEQLRRLGDRELRFGARYGEAFVLAGFDYASNAFEVEAREFERRFVGDTPAR